MESVSELERRLSKKLKVTLPSQPAIDRIRHLMAFWPHFALHNRSCDLTGKKLVSTFRPDCPHPIWERNLWIERAKPPQAEYDFASPFFEQLADLFKHCPIPHNLQLGNENCEYTDDWWHSRNCYLSHSGVDCEDCRYCYRVLGLKDCQYCVYSWESELSIDLLNCRSCYHVAWALNSQACRDSAFLFDCRNCSDCLCCWNLRNKKYCYKNKQLTAAEFKRVWDDAQLSSWRQYEVLQDSFISEIKTKAWWKSLELEQTENCTGTNVDHSRDCENCRALSYARDCVNAWRGYEARDVLDAISPYKCELVFSSCLVQENCFDIRSSFDLVRSRHLEYCAHCYDCENCFACCGLVRGRFCILNKTYEESAYHELKAKICASLEKSGLRGQFFPGSFAATPYDESLAGTVFPLSYEKQMELGYNITPKEALNTENAHLAGVVPEDLQNLRADLVTQTFWDREYNRPFKISKHDIDFAKKTGFSLPNSYYLKRIKNLYSLLYFGNEMRQTICGLSSQATWTNLPKELDGRIVSEAAHEAFVK